MDPIQSSPGAPGGSPGLAFSPAQPIASPAPALSAAHQKGCKCGECEAKRAKWREKYHRSKARQAGGEILPPISESATPAGQPSPQGQTLNPVPHDPALFKPLVEILVAGGERGTKASLVNKAKKISNELAKQVEEDSAWNPVAKGVLLESGPHVAAKWAARIGLPADSATDLAFLAAASQIGLGYLASLRRLDESLKRIEEAQGKKPEVKA